MVSEEKIKTLYKDGMVNLNSIFDQDLLRDLVNAKESIFKEYPFGQDDKLSKKDKADFVRPGSYMIWDIIEQKPIFSKIWKISTLKKLQLEFWEKIILSFILYKKNSKD